jgi:hypothetical protein
MDDHSAVLQLEGGGRMRVVRRAIADRFNPTPTDTDAG